MDALVFFLVFTKQANYLGSFIAYVDYDYLLVSEYLLLYLFTFILSLLLFSPYLYFILTLSLLYLCFALYLT